MSYLESYLTSEPTPGRSAALHSRVQRPAGAEACPGDGAAAASQRLPQALRQDDPLPRLQAPRGCITTF